MTKTQLQLALAEATQTNKKTAVALLNALARLPLFDRVFDYSEASGVCKWLIFRTWAGANGLAMQAGL